MSDFKIGAELADQRLDRGLAALLGISLRTSRRMIGDGRLLLNDHAASSGERLKVGDQLRIILIAEKTTKEPEFLGSQGEYHFLYKPAGLHTATLAGREDPSLESFLPQIRQERNLPPLTLLQRLDFGTAGIICATSGAADAYRAAEQEGACRKYYITALQGLLRHTICAKNRLAVNGGVRVRIKSSEGERHTLFEPLWQGRSELFATEITLARCMLARGQRHQIRAHAQAIGHPLAGDGLYGASEDCGFLLAHYCLEFPGHRFFYLDADWPLAALCRLAPVKAMAKEAGLCT